MAPSTSPACCSASPFSLHSACPACGSTSVALPKAVTASWKRFSTIRLSPRCSYASAFFLLLVDGAVEGVDGVLDLLARS